MHQISNPGEIAVASLEKIQCRMEFMFCRPTVKPQPRKRKRALVDNSIGEKAQSLNSQPRRVPYSSSQPAHESTQIYDNLSRNCSSQPASTDATTDTLFDAVGEADATFKSTEQHKGTLDSQACILLVDASLRTLIGGAKMRPGPKLVVEDSSMELGLAEISPHLFNPGYLQVNSSISVTFLTKAL